MYIENTCFLYIYCPYKPAAFDFNALPLPAKGKHTLKDLLHSTDGNEPVLPWDEGRFFDHEKNQVQAKYTLTANLWRYLQDYAEKHRAQQRFWSRYTRQHCTGNPPINNRS